MLSILSCLVGWSILLGCHRARLISPGLSAFCLGISTYPILQKIASSLSQMLLQRQGGNDVVDDKRVYGLEHGVLNIELPTKTMWMNLGYWKDKGNDFPAACSALLEEVMLEAALIKREGSGATMTKNVKLLDVGYGCGDQSMHIAELGRRLPVQATDTIRDSTVVRLISYTGITMNRQQFELSHRRLKDIGLIARGSDQKHQNNFNVFRADAAKPTEWTEELKQAAAMMCTSEAGEESWVLGLDSMYHFAPSRKPLFAYAQQHLRASIMAFDLALPDNGRATFFEKLLLRLFCAATGTPFGNLVSKSEYCSQLRAAGYQDIRVKDISEHVFSPLVNFLQKQDSELKVVGKSIGPFRVASWVFAWWARTGLVRGYIVVARHPSLPGLDRYASAG